MKYLALTNHGNVSGCLKWQKECDKQGIQPILGAELYIVPDAKVKNKEKAAHILILATNHTGWTELSRILTYANLVGFHSRPRIDYETLLNSDLSGWIITTACTNSWVKLKGAEKVLDELKDRMWGRLYLEIMPHSEQIQIDHHKNFIIPLREELGLPLVATNDCHYVLRGDWKAQECLLAIQKNAKWNDPNRWKFDIKGLHLRSETEMRKAFERQGQFKEGEIQEALENAVKIAKQCCDFRIPKQEINLPIIPKYDFGMLHEHEKGIRAAEDQFVHDQCHQRLLDLFGNVEDIPENYLSRFDQEYELISKKNFARYFLIIYDIMQYCNKAGIMTGPGRGSVGGSLVSFLLGITKIDPLEFDIPFSRFLSENRIDYPDIDIDFEDSKREQVVDYIRKTYGQNNVCGISTDSRMKSRGVIWDVGRVFDIPTSEIKNIAQHIQTEDNKMAVATCIEEDPIGKKFKEDFPDAARLASKLEGQLRHFGQHPAAVVICADDLTTGKYGPLRVQKGNVVSAWDMEDSEYNGLMKLDILGLTTLSILSECLRLINSRNGEETSTGFFYHPESESFFVDKNVTEDKFSIERLEIGVTLDKIPLGDEEVFKQLSEGKTSGVFQFSARPTTQLCKEVGVESFNDMVAIVALVRPGPTQSGMTENFTLRKHGQKWKPLNSIYEEITKDTYGLIVYQEQVMQVISKVAGLSESTADEIRKVIGKKRDVKEFEPYRIRFLNGCKKQKTLSEREANEFWEGLKEHAHYCVTGDTLVYRGSCNDKAGREIKVKDLYLLQKSWNFRNYGYKILSMHNDEFVRPNKVKAIYDTGIQNVSFIRTNSGRSIRATEKHLFLTSNGWIKLKNIHVGDLLKISDLKSPSYHGSGIGKGYYTVYEKVEEIIPVGKRQTYDIEMEENPRNFVANGFIVHNSFNKAHSVEYAMIGYWTCVDGTTRLYDWDNKKYTTISKAYKTGINNIACYNEDLKTTIPGKVRKIIRTTGAKNVNLKMCFKLRTKSGRVLRCSEDHFILTSEGWKKLKDINTGDLIASEKIVRSPINSETKKKIAIKSKFFWNNIPNEKREIMREGAKKGGKKAWENGWWYKYWNNLSPSKKAKRLKKLIEAGAKSNNGFQSRFKGKAKDGHYVFSYNEKYLDDWLFEHSIQHQTQVYINGKFADFFAKGVYIEFDGMNRPDEYFEDKFKDEPYIVIKNLNDISDKLCFLLEEDEMRAGRKVIFEPVISITKWKLRVMYDVIMENPPHNFLANEIVVHNCWLRIYYPEEFLCACLSYSKAEKQELIDEVLRQEFKVVLPKVGISDASRWTLSEDGKTFYAPFTEVNSIGPEQARKVCAPEEDQNVGFFNIKPTVNSKTELGKLLNEIGANDPEAMPDSETIQKHFQFILSPPEKSYPKLIKLTHTLDLGLESYYPGLLHPVKRFQNKEIKNCSRCELSQECEAPVLPSPGIFNAFITGEAPGQLENEYGRGFYEEAPAGELLWKELGLYGLERRMFFVNNIVRCYPSSTRTPKPEHIEACLPWFREEVKIIQPRLILAIGNTCVKVFKNQDGGIQKLSGTTEWNEEYGAWICYTLHPAAVARRPSNSEYFEKGIRNFARRFKLLTGKQYNR